jgi:hypothetical protein
MPGANWDEVGELLGNSDDAVIQQVLETGASVDDIGEALSDLEAARQPRTEVVAKLHRILEPLYAERDNTTFSILGVPI